MLIESIQIKVLEELETLRLVLIPSKQGKYSNNKSDALACSNIVLIPSKQGKYSNLWGNAGESARRGLNPF